MSTPTNIPETPMGETKQDSYFESKEKFLQQLHDIFQTTLNLTGPGQFDQLCQSMEYKQYLTINDFYDSSYNDPEKFDTKGPATEYKWKGKMNHLSPNVNPFQHHHHLIMNPPNSRQVFQVNPSTKHHQSPRLP